MYVRNSSSIMKRILMSRPDFLQAAPINEIAKKWSHTRLDTAKMQEEHRLLVDAYRKNGVKVEFLEPAAGRPNSVFSRDFGGCIHEGYILGKFREPIRFAEREAYKTRMAELGIPLVAEVTRGLFEGGDFTFLDDTTIAVGMAARSNPAGVDEIREQLAPLGYHVAGVQVDEKYLHFDLCFNLVDCNLAVAFLDALPEDFLAELARREIETIPVPANMVFQHGCNLQSIGNRRVVSLKQNIHVNEELSRRGYDVIEVDITEILKAGGGPHCMTFPLARE